MSSSTTSDVGPAKIALGVLVALGLLRTVLLLLADGVTVLGFHLAGSSHPYLLAQAGAKLWLIPIDVLTVVLVVKLLARENRRLGELLDPRPVSRTLLYVVAGVVAIYITLGIGSWVGNFLIYYGAPTASDSIVPPVWVGLLRLVVAPLTVAVAEETFYRGYLLPRLQVHMGRVGAVVLTALLAAFQGAGLNIGDTNAMLRSFVSSFIVGLGFGFLYLWHRRVVPLVVVHWFFEAVVGLTVLTAALA